MTDSFVIIIAAAIALIVGGFIFVRCAARIETGLSVLTVTIFFGGIVSMNFGSGAYSVVFRDVFVVIPIYIGVFFSQAGQKALFQVSWIILLPLVLFVSVLVIGVLNPNGVSFLEMVVGIKVWLLYVPFLFVGVVIAQRPDLLTFVIRQMLFWGLAACAIGLLQSILFRIVGYEDVMGWFFGASARQVTQEFAFFDVAGGIYRTPGTFSFTGQYGIFLFVYLTIAIIATNTDPNPNIRVIAQNAVMIAIISTLLCGSRANLYIIPFMLMAYVVSGVMTRRLLLWAPIGVVAGGVVLAVSSTDIFSILQAGRDVASDYVEDNFFYRNIYNALGNGAFGVGVGSSTSASRYFTDESFMQTQHYEPYFAKAAMEIGWFGFVALVLLFLIMAIRAIAIFIANRGRPENAFTAPLMIYIIYVFFMNFKASLLDLDPSNIFFWLFLGLLIGIDRFKTAPGLVGGGEGDEAVARFGAVLSTAE